MTKARAVSSIARTALTSTLVLMLATAFAAGPSDEIARPSTVREGDPTIGRQIVVSRQTGLCLLCHSGPFPEERFQGSIGPDLRQSVAPYTEGQLRARIMDPRNGGKPDSIMPAYYRTQGLQRVDTIFRDKPILDLQQIEHVVAFLVTLK